MENRRGISGNGLKLIALLSMLTDHFGAVVVERTRVFNQFDTQFWDTIYGPLRSVGRLAFPIFCFLLVEGFIHTKDVKKYFFRLMLFAFLSEIPFNLALTGAISECILGADIRAFGHVADPSGGRKAIFLCHTNPLEAVGDYCRYGSRRVAFSGLWSLWNFQYRNTLSVQRKTIQSASGRSGYLFMGKSGTCGLYSHCVLQR